MRPSSENGRPSSRIGNRAIASPALSSARALGGFHGTADVGASGSSEAPSSLAGCSGGTAVLSAATSAETAAGSSAPAREGPARDEALRSAMIPNTIAWRARVPQERFIWSPGLHKKRAAASTAGEARAREGLRSLDVAATLRRPLRPAMLDLLSRLFRLDPREVRHGLAF